ncbi:HAD family hydrolase [Cohnella silvisoli]|uniref:HAD-IIB family hydrolase n=1 Tax=Cohnella silvisoli TaxID=2873699 RepID=A0ABV1KSC5_9BACL|nr:HAD-IIB family hydrolase [Cohnella silvisoli]MCD9024647.1 HAD-IIB family hydrolase [Cohnella silvisoli]
MANKIRMIAMDFDLTLVNYTNEKGFVPVETQQLLKEVILQGIEVGIVSGRRWEDMKGILQEAGVAWGDPFPSFIITRETFLYWIDDGKMIPDEEWNRTRAAEMNHLTRTIFGNRSRLFDDMESKGLNAENWILWSDYGLEIIFESIKEAEKARVYMSEYMRGTPMTTVNRNSKAILVTLETAGKGNSLMRAAESKGYLPQQVLAMGDSLNDLTMLDGLNGFHSGAVSNADEAVKLAVKKADGVIAAKASGEGIYEIILEYRQKGLLD